MDAYIIYSPEFEESIEVCNKTFKLAENHGLTPHKFRGINHYNATGVMEDMNISPDYTWSHNNGYFKRQLDSGCVRGCFMSHFVLWNTCIKLDKPIVILEHDGMIVRDIPKDLDWIDVLDLSRDKYDIGEGPDTLHPYDHPTLNGAFAYAIKPHAALILVKHALIQGFRPTDVFISSALLNVQYIKPQLAILDADYKLSLTDNVALWD